MICRRPTVKETKETILIGGDGIRIENRAIKNKFDTQWNL